MHLTAYAFRWDTVGLKKVRPTSPRPGCYVHNHNNQFDPKDIQNQVNKGFRDDQWA